MTISFVRTVLLYIVILFALRLMGKRQISELQTSELVITLLISDIAAIPMQDTSQPLVSGVVPIMALIICEIFLSLIMLKSHRIHRLICGKPILLINGGQIDQSNMKKLRMTTEDLFEQLREKDIVSLQDVDYAIMEPNGKLSVIKKPEKEAVTAQMMNIKTENTGIEAVVVCNGSYSDASIAVCRKSRKWVDDILKSKNISRRDVFLMTANSKGDFHIVRKENKK